MQRIGRVQKTNCVYKPEIRRIQFFVSKLKLSLRHVFNCKHVLHIMEIGSTKFHQKIHQEAELDGSCYICAFSAVEFFYGNLTNFQLNSFEEIR